MTKHFYENSPINQQNSLKENNDAKKIEIDCYKLNTILENQKIKTIDYLNIDAEGNDLKVISTFDFKKFSPSLISIEFNDYELNNLVNSDINILMEKNDYKLISSLVLHVFILKRKSQKNSRYYEYPIKLVPWKIN